MRQKDMVAVFLLVGVLWSTPLPAETYLVLPDGTGDYPTIQDAIDVSVDGDTVELGDGIFTGEGNIDILYHGMKINVRSRSGIPELCVIDCTVDDLYSHNGFSFQSGEDSSSILQEVTITGADAGGVLCWSSSPTIIRCIFLQNDAGFSGGGVVCTQPCSPTFIECEFRENTALEGMAMGAGAFCMEGADPRFLSCLFLGNEAGGGGGLSCRAGANPTVENCQFSENHAIQGGGISLTMTCSAKILQTVFEDNTAESGAGIFLNGGSSASVDDSEYRNNTADYSGGGIYCGGNSSLVLESCSFIRNSAPTGAGISYFSDPSLKAIDCVFLENTSTELGGGLRNVGSPADLTRCLFQGNSASQGGAIHSSGSIQIDNSTLYGNDAPEGAGIFFSDGDPELTETIIAFSVSGSAVYCEPGGGTPQPTLVCCDIFGNDGGDWVDCIANQAGIDGNFSSDPLFCDPGAGDFTLRANSPCLAGNHPDGADCGLIGAYGEGCDATATEHTSWSGVKSLFR